MLIKIDANISIAQQKQKYIGLEVGTKMTIISVDNNELVIISPIKINDRLLNQINEIGIVKHIIAPNLFHYLYASDFKKLFPSAIFWAGSDLKIKCPHLSIDQTLNHEGGNFNSSLEYLFFDGFKTTTFNGFESLKEFVFFHSPSKTLILTDTAYNIDNSFSPFLQLVAKITGDFNNLKPSFLEKIATTDKEKIKESVKKVLEWNFDRVIVAHGSLIESNGKDKLRKGYEQFLNCSLS